jgi:hypothetical protein
LAKVLLNFNQINIDISIFDTDFHTALRYDLQDCASYDGTVPGEFSTLFGG